MMKKLLYVPILLLLVCCTQSKEALHILENIAKEAITSSQLTLEDAAKKAKPDHVLSEEETKFVSGSNTLSLKLFRLLANKNSKKGIILSPMAVVYSLDMTNNGADGKTQEAISKALGYTADDLDAINSPNRIMLIGQRKEETNVNNELMGYMIITNLLMLHEQTKLSPNFQEALEHYHFTSIIDPANTPKGKESINKLCKAITRGEIQSLPINLTGPRVAQLINAVTTKTAWTLPLDKDVTKPMPFFTEDGKSKQVNMMRNYDTMQRCQGYITKGYQVLRMSLENGFSLYAVLPLKENNLQDVIRKLTIKELHKISQNTKVYGYIDVLFPRFTVSANTPTKQLYGEMGLGNLFFREADLGKMSTQPLAVDDVFQRINMNINEEGISVKAIQIMLSAKLLVMDSSSTFTFKANHPFLYYILDKHNNICFIGKYMG